MSKNKDGGPAFPHEDVKRRVNGAPINWKVYNGMSLRDWFAGLAMQALLHDMPRGDEETISGWAYDQADTMLKERDNHE